MIGAGAKRPDSIGHHLTRAISIAAVLLFVALLAYGVERSTTQRSFPRPEP